MASVKHDGGLFYMGTIAIMAFMSIIGIIANAAISKSQQKNEFQQQNELLENQQQFSAEQADLAYERNKRSTDFQDMLDAGFNPNLAALASMGMTNDAASAASSPSAPTTNSAIQALQSTFGQGGQNLYDLFKNNAEIQNIEANTNKANVEAGLMPRDYALRVMTVDQQIRVWDESVKRMQHQNNLDDAQADLLREQKMYYGLKSEAEIGALRQQVNESVKKCQLMDEQMKTEAHKRNLMDAEAFNQVQQGQLANAQEGLVVNETATEFYRGEREKIALEFEQGLDGVPLTADAKKYVHKLLMEGKYDEVKMFYEDVFTTALTQEVGQTIGKPRAKWNLPFKTLEYQSPNGGLNALYNNPIWNPQVRQ